MTAQPKPGDFALDAFLRQQDKKSLLRFVACGSVDHGKSTLIGRLLYESKLVLDDQLDALKSDSRKYGTQGKDLDFALLLDGLAAEREQKITIDVAYRFFTTERRKFIVADAPGHEQYTRNMATGASTADLALILVNAQAGLTRQTRRHSLIVSTLGVRHLVVAVNKMDLVGWSQDAFAAIEAEFRSFAQELGVHEIVCIPMSARDGDNVVARSHRMDWYRGPTLLEHLEQVEPAVSPRGQPFRMPVQLVNRPNADFRGYSGLIADGDVYVGMPVRVMPSERLSSIDRIVTFDGDVERAAAGQSVTITLADEIDASRGDVLADAGAPPAVTDLLSARVVWMGKEALAPGRHYLIKLGTCTATATVGPALHVLDLDTRASVDAERLFINDIGHCVLRLDRAVAVDPYAESRETGSFILIDRESFDTVGMGFVETTEAERPEPSGLRKWLRVLTRRHANVISRLAGGESHVRSIAKAVSWRTTGSIDTFIVTLVITGSAVFAGSIAVTEILTKITLYYFHERIWSMVPWGRASVRTRA
jgi:sulfate adenylyltransferase large subunit